MVPLITAREQVLTSPELLHCVFTYIVKSSKPSIARVCKQWADISIPMIWETLSGQNAISNILLPSGIPKNDGIGRFPSASDWSRFDGYARYVRTLDIDFDCPYSGDECESLQSIASLRPQQPFPYANKLTCHLTSDVNVINRLVWGSFTLMTNKITDFQLHIDSTARSLFPKPNFDTYLCLVGSRMPCLRHLEISCLGRFAVCEKSLCDLLESCRTLVDVTLPGSWITSAVFKVLAQCPIKAIRSNSFNCTDDAFSFLPLLDQIPDSFPSLTDITLHICYDEMINFVKIFSPCFLQCIHIISPKNPTSNQVHSLAQILSVRYPGILDLNLGAKRLDAKPMDHRCNSQDINAGISLIDLEPLFMLSKLEKLRISNHYPLNFSDEDVETFVSKFPTIRTLLLNEKPSYRIKSRQTWSVIFMIAARCPLLRELSLYIGPGPMELPSPYLISPLPFLQSYCPGFTPLTDIYRACLFFGLLLPEQCVLDCAQASFDRNGEQLELLEWGDVASLLPMFQKFGVHHLSTLKEASNASIN